MKEVIPASSISTPQERVSVGFNASLCEQLGNQFLLP